LPASAPETSETKPLGFWAIWSLTVGTMIGSGVFTLPVLLAPYGLQGFAGWGFSAAGAVLIALTIGRLASRATRSGGPFVYVRDSFGDLAGFLVGWSYWCSYWIAIPTVAVAFVGYLRVFVPGLAERPIYEMFAALALIWTLTLIAIRGVREAGAVQIGLTFLKIAPLLAVIGLGVATGRADRLPEFNPGGQSFLAMFAATALLTMWAFSGLETGSLPANDVKDPQRTIPRALIFGTLTVAALYLAATLSVMALVPAADLVTSTSPFADAARGFGAFGPALVAAGALAATAGALNGAIFVSGQMPMAVADDHLAPRVFARRNRGGAPYMSLVISSVLGSLLLLANYSRGLIDAFKFLLLMSTLTFLFPLIASAAAEMRHSFPRERAATAIAALTLAYCVFSALGSGLEPLVWGAALTLAGLPAFYLGGGAGRKMQKETEFS
jgi:APA family basic amino acid/polyamine antiporter